MLRLSAGIAFLLLAASAAAHASTFSFTYTFSNNDPVTGQTSFVYTTSDLITTTETGTPQSCTSAYLGTCTTIEISPENNNIQVKGTGTGIEFASLPSDFFTPGTHSYGGATLTITENVSVAATPEPSSLVFLATGTLGVAGAARRRFARV